MATAAREKFLFQASVSSQELTPSLAQQLRLSLQSLQDIAGGANRSNYGQYCPICGSLDVSSRTVEVQKKKKASQSIPATAIKPKHPSLDIYKCQKCFRSRKVPAKGPTPESITKPNIPIDNVSVGEREVSKDRDSKVQKTSSKKRAKQRKEREGLQALLSKKSDNARPANSFDLMDFMSSRS